MMKRSNINSGRKNFVQRVIGLGLALCFLAPTVVFADDVVKVPPKESVVPSKTEAPAEKNTSKKEAPPKRKKTKKKEKPKEEEMPKATVLDSARFLVLKDGLIVQFGRYKIVRSVHSNRGFAGGLQRLFTAGITPEEYKEMKSRARRKLYGAKHGHHFEFSSEGAFEKYRGWSVQGASRTDVRVIRRGDGYIHRKEGSGGSATNKVAAGAGVMPFDAKQFVLVRMAFERARRAGGTLPVMDPATGALGTLTVALGEGNQYTISAFGLSGRVVLDDSGRIITYHFGDLEFFREGSR